MNEPATTDQRYYYWMEQLIQALTRLPEFDIQEIFAALTELCKLFRVCKGVTCFYDNEEKEAAKEVCKRFKENPQEIYESIIKLLS